MSHQPSSLLELSARSISVHRVPYDPARDLPPALRNYLTTSHRCLNPDCEGVYFDSRVEHVKFVDFCGKYRIPLMQYLCSTKCKIYRQEDMARDSCECNKCDVGEKMKRVLLG